MYLMYSTSRKMQNSIKKYKIEHSFNINLTLIDFK